MPSSSEGVAMEQTMQKGLVRYFEAVSPRARWFALTAFVVVVIDQITKFMAVGALTNAFAAEQGGTVGFATKLSRFLWRAHPGRTRPVEVLESFWHFNYAENPGAAWSFLSAAPDWFRTPFFVLVSFAAMGFIIYYFRKTEPRQRLLRVALALVFGGAVGNLLDRVRLGYVIDFVEWHWYDVASWPTFNVADAGISVGVVIMLADMFLHRDDGKNRGSKKKT